MKKINIISIFTAFLFVLAACEKENETIPVAYLVSGASGTTEITYRNEDEKQVKLMVDFESVADQWAYSFESAKGEIVYLSGVYHDSISSVKLQIWVDGKIYKEKSSVNEPDRYVTVSGTIPY